MLSLAADTHGRDSISGTPFQALRSHRADVVDLDALRRLCASQIHATVAVADLHRLREVSGPGATEDVGHCASVALSPRLLGRGRPQDRHGANVFDFSTDESPAVILQDAFGDRDALGKCAWVVEKEWTTVAPPAVQVEHSDTLAHAGDRRTTE